MRLTNDNATQLADALDNIALDDTLEQLQTYAETEDREERADAREALEDSGGMLYDLEEALVGALAVLAPGRLAKDTARP